MRSYINSYTENTFYKQLTLQCIEFIRKYFEGNNLIRFLVSSDCPQCVKDYILMTYLLEPIQPFLVQTCTFERLSLNCSCWRFAPFDKAVQFHIHTCVRQCVCCSIPSIRGKSSTRKEEID